MDADMHAAFTRVTGGDDALVARLRDFDPFLDDLERALPVDDAQEVRELLREASDGRSVVFTFPSLPEVFRGTLTARPGRQPGSPVLLLVDLTAAGLDPAAWVKQLPVNLGFLDGAEFIGGRTVFAGAVGSMMALVAPRRFYRFAPRGRDRRAVPRDRALLARFELPAEGGRVCWVREVGPGSLRGSLEAGPCHRPGFPLALELTLPDGGRLTATGQVSHLRVRPDLSREIFVDLALDDPDAGARLAAAVRRVRTDSLPPLDHPRSPS